MHLADDLVAPFTGAWIEIQLMNETVPTPRSLPLRERGLKCPLGGGYDCAWHVAPFTGAWIEILGPQGGVVWVESLPLRERGLKSNAAAAPPGSCRPSLYGSVD